MPLKILLADDSLTAQNMGKKILTEAGYEVIAVSNGAQAMKKIVSDKPDLVVLDVYMPGYSGVEVCEHMRNSRETARTPVVLSVGKMEAFQPEQGTRVRADGLIVKPFEASELLAVVKKLAEKVLPAPPRRKRAPELETGPEAAPEDVPAVAEPAPAEPEFESQHQSVAIPQEIASTPVIGMELIPEEAQQPAAPMEFEVQRDPEPVELDAGPHMSSAAGLSGVFELEPAARPAAEKPADPAPVEEFERFSAPAEAPAASHEAHKPAADTGTTTAGHDLMVVPEASAHEAGSEFTAAPVVETFSAPAAAPSSTEFAVERFDHATAEGSAHSATPESQPEGAPELTSWDEPTTPANQNWAGWGPQEPVPALPPGTSHESAAPVLDSAPVQAPATGPVWVAEEAEVEPHESAVPLCQQMLQATVAGKVLESEVPAQANPAGSAGEAEPAQSWETLASFATEQDRSAAVEISKFNEATIPPEFEPFAPTGWAAGQPAVVSGDPGLPDDRPDSPVTSMAASEAQAAAEEPVPASELGHYAAAPQFVPQITMPTVTEAAVDPARVARIVDQVLERLRPELIAAVTRELANVKKHQ